MTQSLRVALVSVAVFTASFARAAEPGYVDFGKFAKSERGECVDITLGGGVLKLASFFVKHEEPAAAEMLRSISKVRVNVISLDNTNRFAATEKMTTMRAELVKQGWDQIVTVQGRKEEDVAIFLKQREGEVIEGVVVTVIDERKNEAVLINVVGNIKAEQLAELGGHLKIDRLAKMNGMRRL